MELHRRRTDLLSARPLPLDAAARAEAACRAVVEEAGFDAAFVVQLSSRRRSPSIRAGVGRFEPFTKDGAALAAQAVASVRALELVDCDDPRSGERWQLAAIPCGHVRNRPLAVVVVDRRLARREAEALAAWMASPDMPADSPAGGPCGGLARLLVKSNGADVAVLALFAQAGLLLNLHARSGGLVRAWRVPSETVWGEAARHAAAFVLGDLPLHAGAECLASLGMRSAALVSIENGAGVPIGSVGIAGTGELDVDIAHRLIDQSPLLGPQIMSLRARTSVPTPDATGAVDLTGFAARVGCRRFAMYSRAGNVLQLVSAHAADGRVLATPPDPYEEQLVCWAAEKGVAVSSDDAAAVVVGDDTILYAQDPGKAPIECLRLALHDLRHDPHGGRRAA